VRACVRVCVRVNRALELTTRNITVRNTVAGSMGNNCLQIGSETIGNFSDILFENIHCVVFRASRDRALDNGRSSHQQRHLPKHNDETDGNTNLNVRWREAEAAGATPCRLHIRGGTNQHYRNRLFLR
jgi:hypothetical protein